MKRQLLPFLLIYLAPSTAIAQAQVASVTTTPPNLVVPNYNTVPVGPFGGLEGTAYAARVSDPSAAWFNPAGLAREMKAQISGSAGVYTHIVVAPVDLTNQGGSYQQLPSYLGFTFKLREGLTGGFAWLTNNAWIQETDAERIGSVAGRQERVAFSADSRFTRRVAALSVGHHPKDSRWRYGGGFAFSLTNLRLVQSGSHRIADPNSLRTLLVTSQISSWSFQLRGQGGVQYDKDRWRFGAAIRTPGLNLFGGASLANDAALSEPSLSVGASTFDTDAAFENHLPWEVQAGAAFVASRFELEVDVQGYSSISPYPMIATAQPTLVYVDAGPGIAPVVVSQPFNALTSASDGTINVGVGGRYKVLKDRNLQIHAGVASNRSPVADADVVFSRVDLVSWTVGASGSVGGFSFSLGVNTQTGTTDDFTFRHLLDDGEIRARAKIRSTGVLYQLAFKF